MKSLIKVYIYLSTAHVLYSCKHDWLVQMVTDTTENALRN